MTRLLAIVLSLAALVAAADLVRHGWHALGLAAWQVADLGIGLGLFTVALWTVGCFVVAGVMRVRAWWQG